MIASVALAGHITRPFKCDDRALLLQWFAHEYKEFPVVEAITDTGYVLEVLRSEHGETYTILIRGPSGPACVAGFGRDWQDIPFADPNKGAS